MDVDFEGVDDEREAQRRVDRFFRVERERGAFREAWDRRVIKIDDADELSGDDQATDVLDLSNLHIAAIPQRARQLRHLVELRLDGSAIRELPEWLGELSDLRGLDLSNTKIDTLPDSMRNLTKLRMLDLSFTRLALLPDWIGDFRQLTALNLIGSDISILPEALARLARLEHLAIEHSRITFPPREIVTQGTATILSYLRDIDQGEKQWKSKLLVAGEAGTGKTSLVKALLGLQHDQHEPMTHGVSVSDLWISHPTVSDVNMQLSVWDFGGQRTYRSAHRFYMTDESLFLLVFSCRDEWDDRQMREWLRAVCARATTSPVVLVGTHARTHRHQIPFAALRRDFPQVFETVFYVDSAEEEGRVGIEELREAIAEVAAGLPLMGVVWPRRWLRAVEAVAALPGNHAPIEHVHAAMADAVSDHEIRASVLTALHHRGDILYFADEPDVGEMVVLHPTWVDAHVTKILDSSDVHDRDGLLSRAELERAWPDTEPALRDHLVGLMNAFDLAYRIDSAAHDDVCLIVDRLPYDPPDYGTQWSQAIRQPGASEVRIVVDFDSPMLLAGIPTWFIAREHRFTTGMHWRHGALLLDHFDSRCHALVVGDDQNGTVSLSVRGVAPVGFLSVLRDGLLTPLRYRYPGLEWKIKVPCPCPGPNLTTHRCPHQFDLNYLKLAVEKGSTSVKCPETFEDIAVDKLLYGLEPTSLEDIRSQLADIRSTVERTERAQMTALEFQRQITGHQLAQAERCPSIFTVTRRPRRLHLGTCYELRLYCEQPGNWHPLPEGRGTFVFRRRPEWLEHAAPVLRILLPLLQQALAVAVPAFSIAKGIADGDPHSPAAALLDLWASEGVRDDLDGMHSLLEGLPGPDDARHDWVLADLNAASSSFGAIRVRQQALNSAADYRALRRTLEALAPPGTDPWGGLTPMVTPEGISIFVCAEHEKQYQFPADRGAHEAAR